jgi:hypothetical protein
VWVLVAFGIAAIFLIISAIFLLWRDQKRHAQQAPSAAPARAVPAPELSLRQISDVRAHTRDLLHRALVLSYERRVPLHTGMAAIARQALEKRHPKQAPCAAHDELAAELSYHVQQSPDLRLTQHEEYAGAIQTLDGLSREGIVTEPSAHFASKAERSLARHPTLEWRTSEESLRHEKQDEASIHAAACTLALSVSRAMANRRQDVTMSTPPRYPPSSTRSARVAPLPPQPPQPLPLSLQHSHRHAPTLSTPPAWHNWRPADTALGVSHPARLPPLAAPHLGAVPTCAPAYHHHPPEGHSRVYAHGYEGVHARHDEHLRRTQERPMLGVPK